jgi:arginine decarboxylase
VYSSVRQLRADAWSSLTELARQWASDTSGAAHRQSTQEGLDGLFRQLLPIENCWAFPGKTAFAELRRLRTAEDRYGLARRTDELHRALGTESYRGATPRQAEPTAPAGEEPLPGGATPKPYFEIHGYRPETGYRVFTEQALKEQQTLLESGNGPWAAA